MVDELEARRRRRQSEAVRASSSSHVRVILPYTDGEVTKALSDLEEVLLGAVAEDGTTGIGAGPEADAVGRLASYVGAVERADPALQPVAPDGRFELVPLHYVLVGRDDVARISEAADLVVRAVRQGIGDDELLGAVDAHVDDIDELALRLERLGHLLGLAGEPAVDADIDILGAVSGAATYGSPPGLADSELASVHRGAPAVDRQPRVVLVEAQFAAYQRLAERIMHVWHPGDPFGRFLFSGPPTGSERSDA